MPKITPKKKILFVCIVWILIFFIVEMSFRVYAWSKGRPMPTANKALKEEWRWARQHLAVGKADLGADAIYDPYTGWKNRPNLKTKEVKTNSQSMRNHREFAKENKSGKRILFVGDSYTYGLHVKNEEVFTQLLSDKLSSWEVLNMAVPGTGTDQQLITFQRYGKPYNSNIVVLGFFVRDYTRNLTSFRGCAKPRFIVDDKNNVKLSNSPTITPEKLYQEYATGKRKLPAWYNSYAINKILQVIAKFKESRFHKNAEGWKILSHIIEQFSKEVRKSGAVPVWLIIPCRDIMEEEHTRYEPLKELIENKCAKLKMLCLRFDNSFRKFVGKNKRIYRPRKAGGHLSAFGHTLAATTMYEFLVKNNLVKK